MLGKVAPRIDCIEDGHVTISRVCTRLAEGLLDPVRGIYILDERVARDEVTELWGFEGSVFDTY